MVRPLPLFQLQQHQRTHRKLGLAPWAISEKPPLAIRRLWVSRLVADFQQWREGLAAHYPDFYLAVWLFEPAFGESQLVAAVKDELNFYDNTFGEPLTKPLPAAYLALPGVAALHWTARARLDAYWPDEFADLPAWQRQRPYWKHISRTGERMIIVQTGWVWVGQLPKLP